MTTLMFKRMFKFNGENYLYKKVQTAPNEIQTTFGQVAEKDKFNHLDFIPKTGITHKVIYDHFTHQPTSLEKMIKEVDDIGNINVTETESVHKSKGSYPYWVTLKGNKFETAYVKTDDVKKIELPDIETRMTERDYEGKPIGYDRTYYNGQGDVLEYSYFPNFLDPRANNTHPAKDNLDENIILKKAGRLIQQLKNIQ